MVEASQSALIASGWRQPAADHAIKLWRLEMQISRRELQWYIKTKSPALSSCPTASALFPHRWIKRSASGTSRMENLSAESKRRRQVNAVEWVARTIPLTDPNDVMLVSGGNDNLLRSWSIPAAVAGGTNDQVITLAQPKSASIEYFKPLKHFLDMANLSPRWLLCEQPRFRPFQEVLIRPFGCRMWTTVRSCSNSIAAKPSHRLPCDPMDCDWPQRVRRTWPVYGMSKTISRLPSCVVIFTAGHWSLA